MTLKTFTFILLLISSSLLFTGCNNDKTDTAITTIQNPTSLTLTIAKISLNKDDNTTVKVMAEYKGGATKDVTEDVSWEMIPENAVTVQNGKMTAKKDVPTNIKAKIGTVESNSVDLKITWTVNGHELPPEPDKALNDSTLLGIDINNNGVRDDVERYIYERFGKDPEYPKTKIALAMQDAWATQKILESPTIESKKYLDDAIDCQYYWFSKKNEIINKRIMQLSDKSFDEAIKLDVQVTKWQINNKVFNDKRLKDKKLNTKERILRKFKFNEACSGHIFKGRGKETIENCLINIDKFGE